MSKSSRTDRLIVLKSKNRKNVKSLGFEADQVLYKINHINNESRNCFSEKALSAAAHETQF